MIVSACAVVATDHVWLAGSLHAHAVVHVMRSAALAAAGIAPAACVGVPGENEPAGAD